MLRLSADRRTLAFVMSYFLLVALGWNVQWPLWATAPLWVATCCFSWFVAVITHNTVHCPMFHSKRLNKAFQVVLSLGYGHPVSTFVPGHNLSHHKYTEGPKDVMRTTKMRYRWNLLNLFIFFPVVAKSVLKGEREFVRSMRKRKPAWFRQLVIEGVVLLVVTVALFIIDWRNALIWWYVPHIWAAFGIITINLLQHDGCDPDHEFNHSRNFVGRAFGWWTFNNGFHAIHHIEPGLHWSLLRARHLEIVAPNNHDNLDQPSMAGYLWTTYAWPGKRLRFDGTPLVLGEPLVDESWVPTPGQRADYSLGAEA